MKRILIIALSTGISFMSWGQKADIQSANNYLSDKDYDHALEYINKVTQNPMTANEAKAWYVRGNIYLAMQQDPKFKDTKPYKEAAASYMKALELKPNYGKDEVNAMTVNLVNFAYNYYNEGVAIFNSDRIPAKYGEAKDVMQKVVDIHDFEVKQKLNIIKQFDTLSISAKYIIGSCLYNLNKYDEALPLLTEVKNSQMVKSVDLYVHLAEIYGSQNKPDERLALIKEGEAAYPKDESLKAMEINYYIKSGKIDVLTGKLEESVKEHPDNSELWFNLGTIYMNTANPKGGTPPANAAELITKAEQAYVNAIKLDPENVDYNYNIGAMYYNEGVDLNEKMNAITGTSTADNKKYDDLKTQRLNYFIKAQPYLEKCLSVLEAKGDKMRKEDYNTYIAAASSLREIYGKEDKADKATEMTNKLQGKK